MLRLSLTNLLKPRKDQDSTAAVRRPTWRARNPNKTKTASILCIRFRKEASIETEFDQCHHSRHQKSIAASLKKRLKVYGLALSPLTRLSKVVTLNFFSRACTTFAATASFTFSQEKVGVPLKLKQCGLQTELLLFKVRGLVEIRHQEQQCLLASAHG